MDERFPGTDGKEKNHPKYANNYEETKKQILKHCKKNIFKS